jgi:hypothetical protein
MNEPQAIAPEESNVSESDSETKAELIERLLAKSDLDYKCCGSHCHATPCDAG